MVTVADQAATSQAATERRGKTIAHVFRSWQQEGRVLAPMHMALIAFFQILRMEFHHHLQPVGNGKAPITIIMITLTAFIAMDC